LLGGGSGPWLLAGDFEILGARLPRPVMAGMPPCVAQVMTMMPARAL
jgi:hypothetical protein